MAKVTITIDDTDSRLVAAFGEGTLETIANENGYMTMVEKTEEELPSKVEVTKNEIDPITGESSEVIVMEYPEGTEMYKPNPQTTGDYVGQLVLSDLIAPFLLKGLNERSRKMAMEQVDAQIEGAKGLLKQVAEVKAE
jgi:hypothetical protein